jgi:predicted choloylglycine hydrolase
MPVTQTYASSSAEIADGIWRMTLREKNHYETGFAYGTLLARMRYPIIRVVKSRPVSWLVHLVYLATRRHFSAIRIPAEYLDELRGYSDATGIPYNTLYFINFSFDILKRYGFHCSTIALSQAGKTLVCRNTDLLPWIGSFALKWLPSIVVDMQIPGRTRFVHNTPGFFLGALNGFNERGIAVTSHQVLPTREPAASGGLASVLLPRLLLEQSTTVEDAGHIIHRNRIRRCLNVMVASATESHVYEISPGHIHVIRTNAHYLCCTTHFQHEDLHRLHRSSTEGSQQRLQLMNRLARDSVGTVEDAIVMLQSTENGTGHDGSGFSPTNDGTYQSFVIDLTDRTIYISDGKTLPVSLTGTYRALSFS